MALREEDFEVIAGAAPPNLALAVERIAAAIGVPDVAAGGPTRFAFGDGTHAADPDPIVAAASAEGGIVVLTGAIPWAQLSEPRVVIAVDLDDGDASLDRVSADRENAAAAGWRIAHTSLLHAQHAQRREGRMSVAIRAGDPLAELLENGPLGLALDPHVAGAESGMRPARVLIASYEITGPTGNGGIGTAYHSLAHVLAAAGHDVTLLFTGWLDEKDAVGEEGWRAAFAASGIRFEVLGTPWDVPVRSPHHQVRRAYELHRWLAEAQSTRPFDVVHLPETLGHGAYAVTAKHLGIAYRDLEFVIGTHSSTRWVAESNREPLESLDALVTEWLERVSVELADVVLSPTAYLLDYMRDRGWSLPERTFVQPLARPQAVRELASRHDDRAAGSPRELVFFGRMETRKGLEAFCDAVGMLVADGTCPFERVTVLGRPEQVAGENAVAYVTRRAADWGLEWEILPDCGHDAAVAYISERRCVVAIPSLVDNSPNTVIEAMAIGVPFVASRSGGTAELIAAEDLAGSTFDGWRTAQMLEPPTFSDVQEPFDARALATALAAKAADPTVAAPAVDDVACDRDYDRWHRAIAGRRTPAPDVPDAEALTAAVCIVAADGERAAAIARAVASGTRAPVQMAAIVEREPSAAVPGLDVVVATGRETGPARRRVNAAFDADVLIVLRAEEDPDPTLVERVLTAMAAGDCDVLSLVTRDRDGRRRPDEQDAAAIGRDVRAFVPVGGPAVAGALYPAFSVGPYAIRRAALAAVGGYAPDAWDAVVDRELLSRATISGVRFAVYPDPLATVVEDDAWTEVRCCHWGFAPVPLPRGEELVRLLRPFRALLDERLADLPSLLVGVLRTTSVSAGLALERQREREHLVETYERRITEYEGLAETYEERLREHRELIALYESQKEEMRAALARVIPRDVRPPADSPGGVLVWRIRRATRGPVGDWPARALRFARWRVEKIRRKLG